MPYSGGRPASLAKATPCGRTSSAPRKAARRSARRVSGVTERHHRATSTREVGVPFMRSPWARARLRARTSIREHAMPPRPCRWAGRRRSGFSALRTPGQAALGWGDMTMTRDFAGPGDRAGAPGPSVPGPGRRPSPRLLAICAGPATRLRGVVDGRPVDVLSGIVKRPASTLEDPVGIEFGRLGVAGDEQADLTVHGGLEKAVYVYPVEHYAQWRERAARASVAFEGRPGSFGENLLVEGLLESDVWTGDRLEIGELVLCVTMPRRPCYKLDLHLYPGAGREMVLGRQP